MSNESELETHLRELVSVIETEPDNILFPRDVVITMLKGLLGDYDKVNNE